MGSGVTGLFHVNSGLCVTGQGVTDGQTVAELEESGDLLVVLQVLHVSGRQVEGCSGFSVTSCSAGVVCQWSSCGGLFWISVTSCSACVVC